MSDELRSRIGRLAETHDIAPLTADEVISRRSSGVNRQRLLAVAAVVVLVLGVVGVIALTGDDPDVDVAGEGDEGTTVEGASGGGGEGGGADPVAVPANNDGETAPTTTAPFFEGGIDSGDGVVSGGGSDWIVAWGDGFLSYGQEFEAADLTLEELIPDIRERFPAEIIDVVEASGATTLQEQIDAVTEAGLLDEATAIFEEDPELLEAFTEVQSGGTWRAVAQVSDDGETWTELPDFALPFDNAWVSQVDSDGTHLVLVDQAWDDAGSTLVSVGVTSDLQNWQVVEIPVVADATPDFVDHNAFVSGLAIGADGWYLTLSEESYVDLWSLVPDEVYDEIGERGYGFDATPEGIVVTVYEDVWVDDFGDDVAVPPTTIPATTTTFAPEAPDAEAADDMAADPAVPEPWPIDDAEVLLTIPWDDLPLTFDEYNEFQAGHHTVTAWRGGFDGSLTEASAPPVEGCCTIIGTDAGFIAQAWGSADSLLYFSADGDSWTELDLPAEVGWISSIVAVDDGVVIVAESSTIWRAAADGTGWVTVDVPDLPANAHIWFDNRGGRGIATIVNTGFDDWVPPPTVPYETTFEHDGFEIFISDDNGEGDLVITEIATGTVVLDEYIESSVDDLPPFIEMSEEDGTFTFLDPDGEVIVSVPFDVLVDATSSAEAEAQGEIAVTEPEIPGGEYWLVATTDGVDWHVEDLFHEPGTEFGGLTAINGDTVVLRNWDGDWYSFDVG